MSTMPKRSQFRVIISGGGVSGLTLANALQKANIEYLVLERRSEISALVGASISIAPNGWRILDQLGLYEKVLKLSQPCKYVYERDSKGKLRAPRSDVIQLAEVRTGYCIAFLDRHQFVKELYDNLEDKSKVLLNKNVSLVENSTNGVKVKCEDGSSYDGHILVGADGVSSKTREEMWRLASSTEPGLVSKDRQSLTASYRCLFGISTAASHYEPGDFDWDYERGRSCLVFAGPHGKTYYFMVEKLDQVYQLGKIPRYSKEEAVEYAKRWADWTIRPNVQFDSLFQKSTSFGLAALEEGKFKLWSWGRVACLGDSIHKMTLNIGTGGNTAMESAAAFANELKSLLDRCNGDLPTEDQISGCFGVYQKQREDRAGFITDVAAEVMRMQAMEGPHHRFIVRYCLPYMGDFLANAMSDNLLNAELLKFLPVPKRSLRGTMPFNPEQGDCRRESTTKRILYALPFLGICYLAKVAMNPAVVIPNVLEMISKGVVSWENGSAPINFSFYNIKALDDFWLPINIFFSPTVYGYDPVSRQQLRSFLTDYGVVIAIWAFESVRRANNLTLSQLPTLFTLFGQLFGIGVVSPVYYFFHYISTPIEKFKATDMRLTRLNYSLSILPALLLAYYVPLYLMLHSPTLSGRDSWLFLWQMSPIWISLTAFVLSHFIPDTTPSDRIKAPKSDLPIMHYTIGILSAFSAGVWIWTNFTSPFNLASIFVPEGIPSQSSDFVTFIRDFLKVDELSLFGNTFLWLGYLFWDMKHAGMIQTGWPTIIFYAISSLLVLGPGAAAGLGWLWREDIITNRRHKAAITEVTAGKNTVSPN